MGTYAELPSVQTWYDERGDGEPLVLVHGAAVDARWFDPNVDALAGHFHVYAVDLRGHGHTPDVEGPYTYATLSEDLIEFLEGVVGGPAHLVGHSVGGAVALTAALRRADLVRRLVILSSAFHHEAQVSAAGDPESDVTPVVQFLGPSYGEVSPDGEQHFPVVVRKVLQMLAREPAMDASELAGVRSRTLVMAADDDIIHLEHTLALYRGIPNSELAIVPGTSHRATQEKPGLVNAILLDFLTKDPVPTVAPIRRAPASLSQAPQGGAIR